MSEHEVPAYLQVFREFWSPMLVEDGELNPDKIARELYDYSVLLDMVPLVYADITCGRISKPFTEPRAVIAEAEACEQERTDDEVRGTLQDILDAILASEHPTDALELAIKRLKDGIEYRSPE